MSENSRVRPIKDSVIRPGINAYKSDMQEWIAEDASRAVWNPGEWRTFYTGKIPGPIEFTLTTKTLFKMFGLVKGSQVCGAIAAAYPQIAEELKTSEGGINLADASEDDMRTVTDGLVAASVLTADEANQLRTLAMKIQPRWQIRGLPEPQERYLIPAVEELAG